MPKLNPNTPTLMDGEVRLFKRKRSSIWQVVFMMDGRQVRVSTKKRILQDAKEAAREIYLDYRFRQKNGLPIISKRFADVAALCRATMKEQLENGVGIRLPYWLGVILGKMADVVSALTGKNLPVSLIRVKKFASSTEFKSAKNSLEQFVAPFELSQGIEQTLQNEFISPNPQQEIFYTE